MNLAATGQRWLREPLVHFLIAGSVVFWLLSGRPPDLGERRIVVDQAVVAGLVQRFSDSFRRPPSAAETDAMIRDYIEDQVYYREAVRLGLDRDDEVVVRRMRRKMEALAVAQSAAAVPDNAALQAMLARDPARYASAALTTFEQIYLGADSAAGRSLAVARLDLLRRGEPVTPVPAPLPNRLEAASGAQISATFGDEFAAALGSLPQGKWIGPVASGLGLHLVRVTARTATQPPRLAEVRQRLENDWRAGAAAAARERAYQGMANGYRVVIKKPPS